MKIKFLVVTLLITLTLNLAAQLPLTEDNESPFIDVVKNIREAVVNIQVDYEIESNLSQLPFNDEFFKRFFGIPQPKQPQKHKSVAMGSGFIYDRIGKDVYIITNNHVVQKGKKGEITVTLADKAKYEATLIGSDPATDLALIKIEIDKDEPITILPLGDSDDIEVGSWSIAIGNPFGQLGLERTVTVGVISAKGRSNLRFGKDSPIYQNYIQTDAAINPGNSGGPLVNIRGEVIGVNAAITSTSGGNIGIGFAIPINLAKKVVNDLREEGKVIRAYLGILPQEIDDDLRKSLNLDEVKGVLVAKVEDGTPAEKAGLEKRDVIIEFDGKEIDDVSQFRIVVANSEIGKKVPLIINRDGKEKKLHVKLIERPEEIASKDKEKSEEGSTLLGLEVESLESEFARKYNIEAEEGVIISGIKPNSPADDSNLQVTDVILEINDKKIEDIDDYENVIDEITDSDKRVVLFYLKSRNGRFHYEPVNLNN